MNVKLRCLRTDSASNEEIANDKDSFWENSVEKESFVCLKHERILGQTSQRNNVPIYKLLKKYASSSFTQFHSHLQYICLSFASYQS